MADWLDEIEAQADETSPYYLPRLIAEIRQLRALADHGQRDEARAEVDKLRALVQQWQPIETAPKDGTPVLGFMPSYYQGLGGQSVVVWMEDAWYDMRAFATTPSHWMPLPAAPTTREEP